MKTFITETYNCAFQGRDKSYYIYVPIDYENLASGQCWLCVPNELEKEFALRNTSAKYVYRGKRIALKAIPDRNARRKKFKIKIKDSNFDIYAQKSLTQKTFIAWLKLWAPKDVEITTPGNRVISVNGDLIASSNRCYVYFILNSDSNAIKIGRAKDVEKRLKSLQTGSPAKLKLISKVRVASEKEAAKKEKLIHQKFEESRVIGEWFRCSPELYDYITSVTTSLNG